MRRNQLIVLAAIGSAAWAAAEFTRSRSLRMGATLDESSEPLDGDDLIPEPNYIRTAAITVNARPEDIFPWFLQMGEHAGLYSYDVLNRLFRLQNAASAVTILPEYQRLMAGDRVPIGRGGAIEVNAIVPDHCLVTSHRQLPWLIRQVALDPIDDDHTRLIVKHRGRVPLNPAGRIRMILFDVANFIMLRRMLTVVKQRAEALAAQRSFEPAGEEVPLDGSPSPEAAAETTPLDERAGQPGRG